MDSLFGIKLENDRAFAKGRLFVFNKITRQVYPSGAKREPLVPVFLNRASARQWVERAGGQLATV